MSKGNIKENKNLGFTLLEVLIGVLIFALFSFGVYEGVRAIYKIVYLSRLRIVETALLAEFMEVTRNMPYEKIGILGGVPAGEIPYERIFERNKVAYKLITTVRNIDDPFDGTIDSIPRDTAPADYKFVELSIICLSCNQKKAISLNTIIAPSGLENSSNNGALFVRVFDMLGVPIPEATVKITNNQVNPVIDMQDITDAQGFLKIIDIPTSTQGYQISVTKDGYSTDFTVSTTLEREKPVKPHVTIVERNVSESFFSIDHLATLNIETISPTCASIPNIPFEIRGEKLIGEEPPEYKFLNNFFTNASGLFLLNNIEWDNYYLNSLNSSYDVAGTIPILPLVVKPGTEQKINLILYPKSTNSLLVNVVDQATGLPLSDVNVRLFNTSTGFTKTIKTGLGYLRQTDWSGGAGQNFYEVENKFAYQFGDLEINDPAGDLKLKFNGSSFSLFGSLESSTFDLGTQVNFQNITWEPFSQSEQVGENAIRFQIATSNSSTPEIWEFLGPDGTDNSFYNITNDLINSIHNGHQYFRYKVYLETENSDFTPLISDIAFTYTNACTPPGQSFFSALNKNIYQFQVSKDGYQTTSGAVDVSGYSVIQVLMTNE